MEHLPSPDRSTSMDKLVRVLLAFEERPRWRLSELAQYLGLPKSTVHRMLVALKEHGVVVQDLSYGVYQLGYRLWLMTSRVLPYGFFQEASQPILRQLADLSGETAFFEVPEAPHSLAVAKVESHHAVRLTTEVGTRSPLHLGAGRKIMLAYLAPAEQQRVLAYWVPQPDRHAPFLEDLAQIRQEGFAYSAGEYNQGAAALAVPVLDTAQNLVGGISIAGPAERFTRVLAQGFLPQLMQAAQQLGQRLAHYPASRTAGFQ